MPSSWQKVAKTPPICITIRLPFVLRYFCRSIRVRGRWNTPKSGVLLTLSLKSGLCVRPGPVLTRFTWEKMVLMRKQLRSLVRFSCQNADAEKQGEGRQQQTFSACLVALKGEIGIVYMTKMGGSRDAPL